MSEPKGRGPAWTLFFPPDPPQERRRLTACGSLVATGLGSDAGIESLGQVLDFLSGTQSAVAGRIKETMT